MSENNFNAVRTYSRDEISGFTDRELTEVASQLKKSIRDARRSGRDTTHLEVEYCYLDNERQKRESWGHMAVKPKSQSYRRNYNSSNQRFNKNN